MADAAKDTAHAKDGHHSHSATPYFVVWAILLVCTGLTVWTGYKDLGAINLPLALCIATLKASLVIWIFMPSRPDSKWRRLGVFGRDEGAVAAGPKQD